MNMKLKKITIHKYKSFIEEQNCEIEKDITVLVGMNESGKTAILEAIAKTNYFQDDDFFKFNFILDYPRKERKAMGKSGESPDAVTCTYELTEEIIKQIEDFCGQKITPKEFDVTTKYDNYKTIYLHFSIDKKKHIKYLTEKLGISVEALNTKLESINKTNDFDTVIQEYNQTGDENNPIDGDTLNQLRSYFKNNYNWDNPLDEYIYRTIIEPHIPKFLYYDEYYSLPARINIEKLQSNQLEEYEDKTAKALFELADIDIDQLINSNNYEVFKSELEATSLNISDEIFKYWKANKNLEIEFGIEYKKEESNHILDIRIKNKGVTLSLKNRSKGFNWFFSFLVWFKKIQEDKDSNYILLLDEPGLNLHASAQNDLLDFIEDLANDYQIIYTTHSPFMISSDKLNRVRTVLETDEGSILSDSIQEKDPNTLFPLQAALGYDIAQNLFISDKNLLVEGVSDLIILTTLSSILEKEQRAFLNSDITIVPVGGLDKVTTFISLLRGSKLKVACLLDFHEITHQKMRDFIKEKIIKESNIRYFKDYLEEYSNADIEDLFEKSDYLKLFNNAYEGEYKKIELSQLNDEIKPIVIQINQYIEKDRYNHYRPAYAMTKIGMDKEFYSDVTLNNFEKVFEDINKILKK